MNRNTFCSGKIGLKPANYAEKAEATEMPETINFSKKELKRNHHAQFALVNKCINYIKTTKISGIGMRKSKKYRICTESA